MNIATDLNFIVEPSPEISRPAFVAAFGGSLNTLDRHVCLSHLRRDCKLDAYIRDRWPDSRREFALAVDP